MAGVVSDLSEIDTLLFSTLNNDPTLRGICPDGVFWDIAPGAIAFVLLSRPPDGEFAGALDGKEGWLRVHYAAQAVIKSSSVVASNNAAFRIHELLHYGLQDITAGNYTIMHIERTIPIRYQEIDPSNTAIKWQHHGGQYSVMVCPSN